ncbi:hypothetical protein K439DRAFT_1619160 [Ramaria rubella]|nr:hypothetical protein K439DRAFT_1619160 [Ramaria rubella]
MMWGWGHDIQIQDMIQNVQASTHGGESLVASSLLNASSEAWGTVEDVALAHEDAITDASVKLLVRSPVLPKLEWIPPRCEATLANYYNWGELPTTPSREPGCLPLDMAAPRGSAYLTHPAIYYHYIIKDGCWITASMWESSCYRTLQSSLVKVHLGSAFRYSEVIRLFEYEQPEHPPTIFAEMQWFNTVQTTPINGVWAQFPELDICFHTEGFTGDIDFAAMPVSSIKCHITQGKIVHAGILPLALIRYSFHRKNQV